MSATTLHGTDVPRTSLPAISTGPAYQAYRILQFAFAVAPLVAGIDKFLHWLVDWDRYLCPLARRLLGDHSHEFMLAVGVIEIIAGIGVALKPKFFGYVVAAWLIGIVVNLLLCGTFFDIALRDFGLALGALALARLSSAYDR
jgi:hypothetical protein